MPLAMTLSRYATCYATDAGPHLPITLSENRTDRKFESLCRVQFPGIILWGQIIILELYQGLQHSVKERVMKVIC